MTKRAHIRFDHAFVEEAVFLAAKARGENDALTESFHREREKIYREALPGEERERLFRRLDEDWFVRMGLRGLFEDMLKPFPLLGESYVLVFFKKVWSQKQEGSELYVQGGTRGKAMTAWIGLQAVRILDCAFLKSFLSHELMHLSDMLDPDFQYSPNPDFGGRSELEIGLIQDRFRVIWNVYVDARLKRRGLPPFFREEQHQGNFENAFPFWNQRKRKKVFHAILSGKRFTQAELLRLAGDRRTERTAAGVREGFKSDGGDTRRQPPEFSQKSSGVFHRRRPGGGERVPETVPA